MSPSSTTRFDSFFLTPSAFRGLVKGTAKAPDIAEEDIDAMFATNVTGLINMTQAILPIYKRRDDGGRGDIINIGSIAGREGYPGGSIYCATKAAVRTFTDAMRRELISTRIRVMEVDPGQGTSSQSTLIIFIYCADVPSLHKKMLTLNLTIQLKP